MSGACSRQCTSCRRGRSDVEHPRACLATLGSGGGRRTGDLFDFALIEVVRALNVRSERAVVLVPWSIELAPLVAAGTIGTAPSIDPENLGAERSGLLPYYPPSAVPSAQDVTLYRATHMTLGGDAPLPFAVALNNSHAHTFWSCSFALEGIY